jgi:FkbM family methyltransferase
LWYPVEGVRHFVRFSEEAAWNRYRVGAFEQVYFRHYQPRGTDVVVDIGAGLGTEIVRLARMEPELRYFAVEIQPWVYECLCFTLAQLPEGFRPVGTAISPHPDLRITPTRVGEDARSGPDGPVPVSCLSWEAFVSRHGIGDVDLLKMNVEGAEAELMDHVALDRVRRVVVATHDFRAERGEGDHFRTRQRLEQRLGVAGFHLSPLPYGWLYAERPGGALAHEARRE